jgi:hypothetical protein
MRNDDLEREKITAKKENDKMPDKDLLRNISDEAFDFLKMIDGFSDRDSFDNYMQQFEKK